MKVCVVALGKIGLPLAVQFASHGHQVIGADIDTDVVALVNRAQVPFPGEAELPERLGAVIDRGTLVATTDTVGAVSESDVVVVVVPLLVDREGAPQFAAMDQATQAIAEGLVPGTLVSYETTLPVGTTRRRFAPVLEAGSGLKLGRDLFVCHSPERVFSGRIFDDLRRYPKLVGGLDDESASRAVSFYESTLEFDDRPDLERPNGVWDLGSAEAAELAKLAETTYRDLNIAFANELARHCDALALDASKVIGAANSQPFSHIHRPGVAVGGHCIPVYPHFLLSGAPDMHLPRLAREVNVAMPDYGVERVSDALGGLAGTVVVVLGAAYRGGVKETAFSGAFDLVRSIKERGGTPLVHDPLYADDELRELGFEPYHYGEPCVAAILQADHPEYQRLGARDLVGVEVVFDGRGVLAAEDFSGVVLLRLGAPAGSTSAPA